MKFILSLFALVLFFAFALVDAAKTVTYDDQEGELVLSATATAPQAGLALARQQEKAGSAF